MGHSVVKRTIKPKAWSESEKRQLAVLVRNGSSAREISAALGRRAGSIKKMAQEMKLVLWKKAKKTAAS
jgi:transposase